MIVMKFGGTSVASLKNIKRIKSIIDQCDSPFLLVVSALSGSTNLLESVGFKSLEGNQRTDLNALEKKHIELINELFDHTDPNELIHYTQERFQELNEICNGIHILQENSDRIRARVMSFGEQLSSYILFKYFASQNIQIELLDSKALIIGEENYLNARVDFKATNKNIQASVDPKKNYIAGGFIASNSKEDTVLLGRGGSDYSAAIYAAALKANRLELWSDVNGMQNANPNIVKDATTIYQMSYKEAFEMAYFGAKVLYPPAIRPVMEKNIPVHLKNTFYPDQSGTVISDKAKSTSGKLLGVSSLPNIAVINISGVGMAGIPGTARRIFQALEEASINVILITQGCSEQSICLGVSSDCAHDACHAIDQTFAKEIEQSLINKAELAPTQSIIAVIGDDMKNTPGLSGKLFSALGKNGINVRAIAQGASERNVSIVVDSLDEHKAVNVIHERFFQESIKQIHLFIAGMGNVGNAFIQLLKSQQQKLLEEHRLEIKIAGICNSTKMLVDTNGLTFDSIAQIKKSGKNFKHIDQFIDQAKGARLRNPIFIDNTASEEVSSTYSTLLENNISIATCNKIACSAALSTYQNLLQLAKDNNRSFQYETTVGAALPIIRTIQDLIISGDHVTKIQAVLSGSLNFIFNKYDGSQSFAQIVKQAKEEGYTEPNPLIDLSGLDVMRKILILSREAGYQFNLNDVTFNGFLPKECAEATSTSSLFEALEKHESHFQSLYEKAHNQGNKLKVIASLENDRLSVELKEVSADSSFYHLAGKDNIVAINTTRYPEDPIIIRGAGAGAEVTASGVFSDLMIIIKR